LVYGCHCTAQSVTKCNQAPSRVRFAKRRTVEQ
jgi:hypothetical protein